MTSIVPWRFAQCGTIEKSIAYLGQYRIILSADTASDFGNGGPGAAAAGAVLKPQGGNCAVLP